MADYDPVELDPDLNARRAAVLGPKTEAPPPPVVENPIVSFARQLLGQAPTVPTNNLFTPGNPFEQASTRVHGARSEGYDIPVVGGIGRLSDAWAGPGGSMPVDTSDPLAAYGPTQHLLGPGLGNAAGYGLDRLRGAIAKPAVEAVTDLAARTKPGYAPQGASQSIRAPSELGGLRGAISRAGPDAVADVSPESLAKNAAIGQPTPVQPLFTPPGNPFPSYIEQKAAETLADPAYGMTLKQVQSGAKDIGANERILSALTEASVQRPSIHAQLSLTNPIAQQARDQLIMDAAQTYEHLRPRDDIGHLLPTALKALDNKTGEMMTIQEAIRQGGKTPTLQTQLLTAAAEHEELQAFITGAEASYRAGGVTNEAARLLKNNKPQEAYAAAQKAVGGKDVAKAIEDGIAAIAGLENTNVSGRLAQFTQNLEFPTTVGRVVAYFRNMLLYGPATHTANIQAQTFLMTARTLAQLPPVAADALRVSIGEHGAALLGKNWQGTRVRTLTGAAEYITTMIESQQRALIDSFDTLRGARQIRMGKMEGPELNQLSWTRPGLPSTFLQRLATAGGNIANVPGKALGAEDAYFYRTTYDATLARFIGDHLHNLGLKNPLDAAYRAERAKLWANPLKEWATKADQAGLEGGLRQASKISEWIQAARAGVSKQPVYGKPLELLSYLAFPFVRIGPNLIKVGGEYSPLGFGRVLTGALRKDTEQIADATGKAVVGSAVFAYFVNKFIAGEVTGRLPSDPGEKAAFLNSGKRPYSILFNGTWYDYGRMEPMSSFIKWSAAAASALQDDQKAHSLGATTIFKMLAAATAAVGDETFLQTSSQFMAAVNEGDADAVNKLVGNTAGGFVPFSGLGRNIVKGGDEFQRKPVEGAVKFGDWDVPVIVQQIEAGIPGYSEFVPVLPDNWGHAVHRPEAQQGIAGAINPFRPSEAVELTPVEKELMLHAYEGRLDEQGNPVPPRTLADKAASIIQSSIAGLPLSDAELYRLKIVAGSATYNMLSDLFTGRSAYKGKYYGGMSEVEKTDAINRAILDARAVGRDQVADEIIDHATTDGQRTRGIAMRVSGLNLREQAYFLEKQAQDGNLTPAVKQYLDSPDVRGAGPDVAERLRAAPIIREYLSKKPYLIGNPQQWAQLKTARENLQKKGDELKARGVPSLAIPELARASLSTQEQALLLVYSISDIVNPERARIRDRNPWVEKYLGGTTYSYSP